MLGIKEAMYEWNEESVHSSTHMFQTLHVRDIYIRCEGVGEIINFCVDRSYRLGEY